MSNILTTFRNYFKDITKSFPDLEMDIIPSTFEEYVVTKSLFEGKELHKAYYLKASMYGNNFNYKHQLSASDNLDEVRANAHKQYDAWKFNINEYKVKTTEHGN